MDSGFTLIEILRVVIIILGILLERLVVRSVRDQWEKPRKKAALADLSKLRRALSRFEVNMGRFPTNDGGLQGLLVVPVNSNRWGGA